MSIYDKIGGAPSVALAVDDFYERVLSDATLAPYFENTQLDELKKHQRLFLGAAIGGPERYEGRDMARAHEGLDITPEAFGAVVAHLGATLRSLGVDDTTIGEIVAALAPLQDQIVAEPPSA
jgi:hemoglobin